MNSMTTLLSQGEANMPKRCGSTVQLNVSVPKNLMPRLKEAAKNEQRSVSNLVSWLWERAMKELVWRKKQ
jgi:predicted HicB family RNase H-like nuclease